MNNFIDNWEQGSVALERLLRQEVRDPSAKDLLDSISKLDGGRFESIKGEPENYQS